jgi:methyl-galactoside transport system substrate-binding protein
MFWRAAAVLSAAFLIGCGQGDERHHKYKIGVSVYQADDIYISEFREWMAASVKEKEAAYGVTIVMNVADAAGVQSLQNDQVDKFISQGYDVMCVNMVDRTAAAVIVDKAKLADIPVVFFNREPVQEDMARWSKVYYVGGKAEQSGVMQGEIIADLFQNHGELVDRNDDGVLQYVMLEGEPGHQDALLRTEYSIATLTRRGVRIEKLANDTGNWQRSQAKEKMSAWLAEFGGAIEVVFSNNDSMALGAVEALREKGYNLPDCDKQVIVIGVDAIKAAMEAICQGALYATVLNDAKSQAQGVIDIAYSVASTGEALSAVPGFDGKYLLLDYRPVMREDVKEN